MNVTHSLKKLATGVAVSAAVAAATVSLGAGTAHAGSFRWCPGDPPPSWRGMHANPAWDPNVCHDYNFRYPNHVVEGIPCSSLICPPGTIRDNETPDTPNIGE
jgi:hypothetical protein